MLIPPLLLLRVINHATKGALGEGNATANGLELRGGEGEEEGGGRWRRKVVQFTAEVDQQIFNLHLRHLSGRRRVVGGFFSPDVNSACHLPVYVNAASV